MLKYLSFFLVVPLLFSCQSETSKPVLEYLNADANIWHMEQWSGDLWVLADYDGRIMLRDLELEKNQWVFPAGSFVFDLKTGDVNRDGKKEIALATASGELILLDGQGSKLWSFQSKLAMFNVGIGNFQGDQDLEVVCGGIDRFVYVFDKDGRLLDQSQEMERLVHRIAVGELSGDEYDDILVIENRTTANLLSFSGDTLFSRWRKPIKVPDELVNWENPRGSFFPFSIIIDDLDGDADNEIIMGDTYFNKQAVMVADHTGESLWISEGLPPFEMVDGSQLEFYSTAFVRSADLYTEYPGKEIISVAGGMIRVWDNRGNLISSANSSLGFTDIEVAGDEIYLGSAPNGDEFVYRVSIRDDWEPAVKAATFKGKIKAIQDRTLEITEQLKTMDIDESKEDIPYDLVIGFGSIETDETGLEEYRRQQEWFSQRYPYTNFRVIKSMKVMEETPPLDENGEPWSESRWRTDALRGTMTVDEILEKARWIEENEIPTFFIIGHSCMPFITLETVEKILQTAPNYTVGFGTFEDEQVERISRYFEYYMKPLAELCLKYGKKICMTKNKGLWWMDSSANPEVFMALFGEDRDEVTIAATEDSNSRTPEVNLMARGGLWQAGLLKKNDVSIHSDLFSFNRYHQWEYPRVGHPYLRLLIAHTTMGMTQTNVRGRRSMPATEDNMTGPMGYESTDLFYHLLGKGIVFSPQPEEALGYSPLGLVFHQPEEKWITDAHNGHRPELWEDDQELHEAVFPHNGSLWGMTNTPDHAFQKVVFNKERQFGYQVPSTPYGLVAIVPEHTDLTNVAHVDEWIHTDGIYTWEEGGQKMRGDEAARFLEDRFEKAAERLLFRQVGDQVVFMQVLKIRDGHYRLFLIDPGWINPKDHQVEVRIGMPGEHSIRDAITREEIAVQSQHFSVAVPAGLFRILDVSTK